MGRIFVLVMLFVITSFQEGSSQNLLINGNFEEVNASDGSRDYYLKNFYFKDWFKPTECSADIWRDHAACDIEHIFNIEPEMNRCLDCYSGRYCAGIASLSYYGYMEHITGKLIDHLEKGKLYEVSFWIKFMGGSPYTSKNFGYKFSKDSFLFQSEILYDKKLSPYYYDLFSQSKVYADYAVDEYILDTTWRQIKTVYLAKGDERFITLGNFAFESDTEFIKRLNKVARSSSQEKVKLYYESNESEFIKYFPHYDKQPNGLSGAYYLLDSIYVTEIDKSRLDLNSCYNCIDNDPMTINIPDELVFDIDRGFEGELSFELGFSLKENEYIELIMEKGTRILLIPSQPFFNQQILKFKYPAKKVRGGKIYYRVRSFLTDSLNEFHVITETKDFKIYSTKKIGHFELESIN